MTQLVIEIDSPDIAKKVKEMLKHIFGVRIISQSRNIKFADKDTEDFINKFAGKWPGNESSDDLMNTINEFKTSRPPISFDK